MSKRILLLLSLFWVMLALSAQVRAAAAPHIVFMIGEDEYKTWETLPEFARNDLAKAGYRVTLIQADPTDKNNFPGLVEALRDADILFVSVRRRSPRREQLAAVREHLAAGKPMVGIRTTCHAFATLPKEPTVDPRNDVWPAFDVEVLGAHYTGHYRDLVKTAVSPAAGARRHPVLDGIRISELVGNVPLYKVRPLEPGVTPLLMGSIPGQEAEPVAWTREFGPRHAKVFFTSLGGAEDFRNPEFRRLLVNGLRWTLSK